MSPTPPPGTESVEQTGAPGADGSRPVRRRALLALMLLLAGAGALWLLRGAGSSVPAESAAWQACRGNTSCIETAVAAELGASDAKRTLAAALAVFEREPTTPPGCHGVTHYIGRAIAASGQRTPQLGELWATCGYGALHGVFETLSLPDDPGAAGKTAYAKCRENEEIRTNRDLMGRCTHALGHSIYTAMGAEINRAVDACQAETAQEAVQQCLGGVYMMDRNARWPSGNGPRDAAGWRDALPHCTEPQIAATCVLSYGEVATFTSETSTIGWLDLCFAAGTGATAESHRERCLIFTGQGAAFDHIAEGPGPGIETCLSYAQTNAPQLDTACLQGIESALDAVGTPAADRKTLTCEILAESRRRCD
jgi:hypothetical protein